MDVRRYAHGQAVRCLEPEPVAATGLHRQFAKPLDIRTETFRPLCEPVDRSAIARRHVDRNQTGLRLFAQREDVMFHTGAAQMHDAGVGRHFGQSPNAAIELDGLRKIADAKLYTATPITRGLVMMAVPHTV